MLLSKACLIPGQQAFLKEGRLLAAEADTARYADIALPE